MVNPEAAESFIAHLFGSPLGVFCAMLCVLSTAVFLTWWVTSKVRNFVPFSACHSMMKNLAETMEANQVKFLADVREHHQATAAQLQECSSELAEIAKMNNTTTLNLQNLSGQVKILQEVVFNSVRSRGNGGRKTNVLKKSRGGTT